MKKQTLAFAISMLLFAPTIAHAEGNAEETPPTTEAPQHVSTAGMVSRAEQIRSTIVIHKKPRPSKHFWDKVAQCETGQNWQNKGRWGGGLGFYVGTWDRFGGREFAKHPSEATREEQIIVANRIAVEGYQTKSYRTLNDKLNNKPYFQRAVGLGGWGCYKSKATGKYRMSRPRYYHAEEPQLVPHAKFVFGEKNRIVKDLQTWLLLPVNGKYDKETRRWHVRWLKKRGYSTEGVPPIPAKSPPTSVVPS